MKTLLILSVVVLFIFIANGCEKDENKASSPGTVELFLIHTYSRIDNSSQIDENSVVTEKKPFIGYSDFLSYDSTTCVFELSDCATEAVKNLEYSSNGIAFAIKANDTLIYTGYFWSSYSSLSCDWIVIDPLETTLGNEIQVKLFYPYLIQGLTIPDKRNDKRIIRIFNYDGKLKASV
jgi:hypothetical protein